MTPRIFPLSLGELSLSSNIIYSALAGRTDYPFRRLVLRYEPGLVFCEMVKMEALVRYEKEILRILDYSDEMHPIGAQLYGCRADIAGTAAGIVEDLGFDVVDFNCACPARRITDEGCGSAMLGHPEAIGEILGAMVAAVRIPVTLKIRTGWDDDTINGPEIVRIAEEAGAVGVTVHGRTRKQGHRGAVNKGHIRACKEVACRIKVMGNGGIFDAKSALAMFDDTGCDGIVVSRGMLGRPWIAQDICRFDRGEEEVDHTLEECRQELLRHFEYLCEYYPEERVVLYMRRIGCWYFKRSERTRWFRRAICGVNDLAETRDLITNFSFRRRL